jgi:PIN domain nuclease of toxin-antitoxin system
LSVTYLDTHIAVYLHDGIIESLTKSAKREIESKDLLLSPMAFLELEYLYQRKRIAIPAQEMYDVIHKDFGVSLCRMSFANVAYEAIGVSWTNDPFDRLIVANTKANRGATLITRDEGTREKFPEAVW